jgi:polyisoprenoid-binding protein YceI
MRTQHGFSETFVLVILSLLIGLSPLALATTTYEVDATHSSVLFRVKHLETSYFYGRFNEISGNITLDKEAPTKSRVALEIKAESVDTFNERRNQHLKSPDFFNVKQFPVIAFKSKSVKRLDADTYEITGDLTLHGVTKTLTIQAKQTGTSKNRRGNELVGFETTFTIKRSEFGMNFMLNGLSDEVKLIVSLECVSR